MTTAEGSLSRGEETPPVEGSLSRWERGGVSAFPKDGVYVGVDPRELPQLAVFKDVDAPWCPVVMSAEQFPMASPPDEKAEDRPRLIRRGCVGAVSGFAPGGRGTIAGRPAPGR